MNKISFNVCNTTNAYIIEVLIRQSVGMDKFLCLTSIQLTSFIAVLMAGIISLKLFYFTDGTI